MAALVAPVYLLDTGALTAASEGLQALLEEAQRGREMLSAGADLDDTVALLAGVAPKTVPEAALRHLLTSDPATFEHMQRQTLGALETLYANPITEEALESARTTLRAIVDRLASDASTANAVYEVAAGFVGPNQVVDEAQTEARRRAAMEQVAPVMVSISAGDIVFQKGERITAQHMLVLKELGLVGVRSGWKVWLGIFILMLLEAALFSGSCTASTRLKKSTTTTCCLPWCFSYYWLQE